MWAREFAEKPSSIFGAPIFGKPVPPMNPLTAEPAATSPPAIAVLDTNVVLDLLLFRDPGAAALDAALGAGRLRWLTTDAMLDELADVLRRPFAAGWALTPAEVLAAAHARCERTMPAASAAPPAPRCTDPDDQKFIDLACALPAAWLFSRDRALLRLARAAQPRGVRVLTPARWAALQTA